MDLTLAVGKGAKNLEPAIKLIKKVFLSLDELNRTEADQEAKRQLPPPEELGLEDLRDDTEE